MITVVGTANNVLDNTVIYPNPSCGLFFLKDSGSNPKIVVRNVFGQIVKRAEGREIDLTNETDGIYFVEVQQNEVAQSITIVKVNKKSLSKFRKGAVLDENPKNQATIDSLKNSLISSFGINSFLGTLSHGRS